MYFVLHLPVLYRLSAVAGTKLKYNNPGITDLSDDNRPNKLAEKFSELYDNEWTAAFEVIIDSTEPKEQNRNEEWNLVTQDANINENWWWNKPSWHERWQD